MRRRLLTVLTVFSMAAALVTIFLTQRHSLSGQALDGLRPFTVIDAEAYVPGEEYARGIRVSTQVDTRELKVDASASYEIDVSLSPILSESFEVVDATVWVGEKDRNEPTEELQPYYNQAPPKNVQARLLFPPTKLDTYKLDVFLAPKNGRTGPDVGLKHLGTPADRDKGIRFKVVSRADD